MKNINQEPPRSPDWRKKLINLVAAGRYAAMWWPEFMYLYYLYLSEDGKDAADEWANQELKDAVKYSSILRLYKLFYLVWKSYRNIAGK